MTQIIAFAGRKASGKNTSANYIVGHYLMMMNICQTFHIDNKGRLIISDVFGNPDFNSQEKGLFDIQNKSNPTIISFLEDRVDHAIKVYSFADTLKQKVCIDILSLTYEQCYGSDDDKNTLTRLRWENMPSVITNKNTWEYIKQTTLNPEINVVNPLHFHEAGFMSAREVMQFVGTEIFRKMYGNVWVDCTIREIQKDEPDVALISDCRFANEVEGIHEVGGKVIRFTRHPYEDEHDSEKALDGYENFDAIIKNDKLSIEQQNRLVHEILKSWIILPDLV